MRITEFVEAVKTELDLNEAQAKDIDTAIEGMRKSTAGNAGGEQDQSARRERGRAARQDLEDRITALLTPAQRTKFDEIKKRLIENGGGRTAQTGRVFVTGKDGKPQGVTVRIGATDGGMTEIVSGLEAGRDIIIGGGPRADAAATTRGPRFGF
jgi:HlyD family secretion protein